MNLSHSDSTTGCPTFSRTVFREWQMDQVVISHENKEKSEGAISSHCQTSFAKEIDQPVQWDHDLGWRCQIGFGDSETRLTATKGNFTPHLPRPQLFSSITTACLPFTLYQPQFRQQCTGSCLHWTQNVNIRFFVCFCLFLFLFWSVQTSVRNKTKLKLGRETLHADRPLREQFANTNHRDANLWFKMRGRQYSCWHRSAQHRKRVHSHQRQGWFIKPAFMSSHELFKILPTV